MSRIAGMPQLPQMLEESGWGEAEIVRDGRPYRVWRFPEEVRVRVNRTWPHHQRLGRQFRERQRRAKS